jgi:PAS domain S-box-containing protein
MFHDGPALSADFLHRAGIAFLLEAIDQMDDVYFWVKDGERRFVYYSQPFATLMGYDSNELIGLRDEDVSPEYLVEKYRSDDMRVLESGDRLTEMIELVHNEDGSYDWFSTTKFPVRVPGEGIIGVAGTTRNVGRRQHAPSRFLGLAPAIELIMTGFHRELSVEVLARHTNLSPSQFSRQFKARFGVTPHAYLKQVRLAAASNLLSASDLPISEIAMQCGYSDQSHLTHDFVARKGMSPGRYRERFGGGHTTSSLKLPV